MLFRRLVMLAILLSSCMYMWGARADSGLQALEVFPDEYPMGVPFIFVSPGKDARISALPGSWYALCRMPIYPGKVYDLLLAHAGEASRLKLYALDDNPFEKNPIRYELFLRKLEFEAKHHSVYGTTIAIPPGASTRSVYLLLEWLPSASNDMASQKMPVPVVLQIIASDANGYVPDDQHGMHWSWHKEWQRPLNDLHVESPLQSERRRDTNETQSPVKMPPDRRSDPPYRLLPY